MGGALGSGRKHNFGYVDGLRESETLILKVLMDWNHAAIKATARNIAGKCGISISSVTNGLYYLGGRGIVRRSMGRSWFIIPNIKDQLIQEFGQTSNDQVSEQARSTPAEQNSPNPSDPA